MDFTNPVLNADWPDPDVVRVDDDFYLVVSSFNRAPGLPVPHSRDLVSWELVAAFAQEALPPGSRTVGVRASGDTEGVITFAWRVEDVWREAETVFPATAGRWVGADVGLFAAARLGVPDGKDHVAFGGLSVDLAGAEEVAA